MNATSEPASAALYQAVKVTVPLLGMMNDPSIVGYSAWLPSVARCAEFDPLWGSEESSVMEPVPGPTYQPAVRPCSKPPLKISSVGVAPRVAVASLEAAEFPDGFTALTT